jgi:hypothetical protein
MELGLVLTLLTASLGIGLIVWGSHARAHLEPSGRAHSGLAQLSIGIVLVSVTGAAWLAWFAYQMLAPLFGGLFGP